MLRIFVSVCLFAVLASTSLPANAQTSDNRTYFTFSQPVTLPGITLPPGMYVFRIIDANTSRRVIRVQDAAGRNYGLMWSIPIQAKDIPKEPEVRFIEGLEGTVPAVRAWWYPGASLGYEFVYPREQATRLAERGRTSVLTTSENSTDLQSAELSRVSSADKDRRGTEPTKGTPSFVDVPSALPPPLSQETLPLASWLGALSMMAGVWSQKGPHPGL